MKTYSIPTKVNMKILSLFLGLSIIVHTNNIQAIMAETDITNPPVNNRTGCQSIDFDTDGDGNPILPGQIIDDSTYAALGCLLYTSPSPRDLSTSRMPSSA